MTTSRNSSVGSVSSIGHGSIDAWSVPTSMQVIGPLHGGAHYKYYGARPLRLREARHGLVLREVNLPIPHDDDEVVARVRAAINRRTRLIVASHMADAWGFVLPVARLAALAREHGAHVLVDGALTFAHLAFDVRSFVAITANDRFRPEGEVRSGGERTLTLRGGSSSLKTLARGLSRPRSE